MFRLFGTFVELFLKSDYQVEKIFTENAFDAVMHFAAVAYVGESTSEPLRCSCLVCLNYSYDRILKAKYAGITIISHQIHCWL